MPDNLQAFKAVWFCWHKASSLSKCLCSQFSGSSLISYSGSTPRVANSRGQEETLPQGAHKFCHCKAATQIPLHGAVQAPMLPPAFLLSGYWGTSHTQAAPLPGISSTLLQSSLKKKETSPSPQEEACSSLSQSMWSQSSPTPVPGPSKCLLNLLQLLGITQSLEQPLLLSCASERNNLRLKERKSSNKTLSLLQITLWKFSHLWGGGQKNLLSSRLISVLAEGLAVFLTALFFFNIG